MQESLIPPRSRVRPRGFCRRLAECLCCCCIKPEQRQRTPWKETWRRIKAKVKHRKAYQDTVFPMLLKLTTDEHTIADLEELSLGPIVSKAWVRRDDLEFYIPQLCNFMLFGEFKEVTRLIKFLLEACKSSFHFAHRVVWFLASVDFALVEEPNTAHDKLLRAVEIAVHGSQRLYIGRGAELFDVCKQLGFGVFPATLATITMPTAVRLEAERERNRAKELIEQYQEGADEPLAAIDPQYLTIKRAFVEDREDDFDATINFVLQLTNASVQVVDVIDKKTQLIAILAGINKQLPAAVYIPFTKYRNHVVLHLQVQELKVFKTKERAPFLIAMEVFNPFEEYNSYLETAEVESGSSKGRSVSMPLAQPRAYNTIIRPEHEMKAENINDQTFMQIMSEASDNKDRPRSREFNRSVGGSYSVLPSSKLAEDQTEDLPEIVPEREIEEESVSKLKYAQLAEHYETGIPEIRRPRAVTIMYVYDNDPDTPSALVPQPTEASESKGSSVFGEAIEEQAARIKAASPYRDLKSWDLLRVIVKSGDDLRQEQLAMQLITQFQEIFTQAELSLWLRPYEIIATGKDCGLIECVDAMSIDSIKKSAPANITTLAQFFVHHFGPVRSKSYREAQHNFIKSLAAYSLLCFVLQIKDRHNGNILMDREGHLVHIDFGFMISNSPGGDFKFEKAPFKLTDEYVGVMEGVRSSHFQDFRKLCVKGFVELRKHQQKLWLLLEMSRTGSGASLPCFAGGEAGVETLKQRLEPRDNMSEGDCRTYVNNLIDESLDHWTTTCYDRYQRSCQNIL